MRALNPFAPFWHVPAGEPDEHPTRFKLRGLNGSEIGYVAPEFILGDDKTIIGLSGKGLDLTLKYGLLDWENFENDSGPVAFHRDNFALIEYACRAELAMRIIAASYAKGEEKKT